MARRRRNVLSAGGDDPDYCVLRFTAERGRYYQNFSSEDFAVPVA